MRTLNIFEPAQRVAVYPVEHHERTFVVATDVVNADDVRVVDARLDARLVGEPTRRALVEGEVPVQPLDRNAARKAARGARDAEKHARHPPFAERRADIVPGAKLPLVAVRLASCGHEGRNATSGWTGGL